jgi:hypothetical protein
MCTWFQVNRTNIKQDMNKHRHWLDKPLAKTTTGKNFELKFSFFRERVYPVHGCLDTSVAIWLHLNLPQPSEYSNGEGQPNTTFTNGPFIHHISTFHDMLLVSNTVSPLDLRLTHIVCLIVVVAFVNFEY